jgi:TPR repeat/Tetratricopeptide repeat
VNRANVLVRLNRIDEAISALTAAHAIDPTNPQIPNNKANALSLLGRFDEALQNYTSALKIAPNYVEAIVNRGNTLLLNRNQDAMASYQEAIRLRPDDADAHYGLSFALLRLGDFKRGLQEYEWRWRRLEMSTYRRDLGRPLWMGDTSIEGKTLLLHAEQGFGDTIHFVRFALQLAKLGGKIWLEVQPALKPLIHEWPGISVFGRGEALPTFDLHCPLLSLPFVLGTSLETISADIPYLVAPAERVDYWRGRIPQDGRLKVGITWSGNKTFRNDRHRSMTLDSFRPILNTPGVTFVTLNPDLADDDVKFLAGLPHVAPLASEFHNFADTAGVIENLDLVISTDTSVPHLAGAMKKEVWILLGFAPDWRWFLDRNDSPWYPTAKLYRQSKIGDWSSLVEKVRSELRLRVKQN